MPEAIPQLEQVDEQGTTVHFNGTVSTVSTPIPSVAGARISEFSIMNPASNAKTAILYVSLDGGTNFRSLPWNSDWSWSLKGIVPRLFIKASAAATAYEAVINFEVN